MFNRSHLLLRFWKTVLPMFGLWLVFIIPSYAANWGDVERRQCVAPGERLFVANLKNSGDWEGDCARLGATGPGGVALPAGEAVCIKSILTGMWGEWRITDASCRANWDRPKKDHCLPAASGVRQWSAILRNIPPGQNATTACRATQIAIPGNATPVNAFTCDQHVDGMWGVFSVPDNSCKAFWDTPRVEECSSPGRRHISSILRNVPPARDTAEACKNTAFTFKHVTHNITDPQNNCRYDLLNQMWGNWYVEDATCAPAWQPAKLDHCVAPGKRQVSARITNGSGDALADCNATRLTFEGRDYGIPLTCVKADFNETWGEWIKADPACPTPRWDTPKRDYCVAPGRRQYASILRDLPGSLHLEVACRITGATIADTDFARPTRCSNEGLGGMWGEFDVADNTCTVDERSADNRKRDVELEAMDVAMQRARDLADQIDGYDLNSLPAGSIGGLLRDVLNGEVARSGGYDVAAIMFGGGGALVLGYERETGYAMERSTDGSFTCWSVSSHALTVGLATGGSASSELLLVDGGIDAFGGDSNGWQSSLAYGTGVIVGVHWSDAGNPVHPLPNVISVGNLTTIFPDIATEYAHGYTWIEQQLDCSRLP